MANRTEPATPEKLLVVAEPLFAAKGFYGVSIREIADLLPIAKSSLLHHFPTKEKLYAALLQKLSGEMTEEVRRIKKADTNEKLQLNSFIELLYINSREKPNRDMIILRELIDNPERASSARQWFFADYLRELTDIIRAGQQNRIFKDVIPELFILHLLGAHRYLVVSLPTMQRLYDADTYDRILSQHAGELKKIVADRLYEDCLKFR